MQQKQKEEEEERFLTTEQKSIRQNQVSSDV